MGLDSREFLVKLQNDIASGSLEIAGFPDVCIRLLRELRDVFVSNTQLERLVRADPSLCLRVVAMANSAAYQSSTGPINDVGGAIARIGLASLRTVVLAHAFATLRNQKVYKDVQTQIGDIWAGSLALSVIARSLSTRYAGRPIDREALTLGGMLSGVGKIYLLSEAAIHQRVLEDFAALSHLLETWHGKLTQLLLEEWEFSEAVIRAAVSVDRKSDARTGEPMADLLEVSALILQYRDDSEELQRRLLGSSAASRLGLSTINPAEVLAGVESDVASLKGALV